MPTCRTAIRRIKPATGGFSSGSALACCGASSKSSLRRCTIKRGKGRRSWPSPIVRGSRSPSTWRPPRRTKSHWCTPHSRSGCQSAAGASHRRQRYESDRLDAELARRGEELIAPHRRPRTQRTQDGRPLRRYQRRWKVERFIVWFQDFRRIVVRYEPFAENSLGMLQLASCLILLRGL